MNLRWSPEQRRFEAEFTADFQGDLEAVKGAGFRTDGAPGWTWWTAKVAVVNKLRKNKPASGLTITPEALEVYKPLQEIEEKNLAVKKQLADFKKTQKKEEAKGDVVVPEGKMWISKEDLPPWESVCDRSFKPTTPSYPVPDLKCSNCGDPVYFYECQEPEPLCLWCEKQLDTILKV